MKMNESIAGVSQISTNHMPYSFFFFKYNFQNNNNRQMIHFIPLHWHVRRVCRKIWSMGTLFKYITWWCDLHRTIELFQFYFYREFTIWTCSAGNILGFLWLLFCFLAKRGSFNSLITKFTYQFFHFDTWCLILAFRKKKGKNANK